MRRLGTTKSDHANIIHPKSVQLRHRVTDCWVQIVSYLELSWTEKIECYQQFVLSLSPYPNAPFSRQAAAGSIDPQCPPARRAQEHLNSERPWIHMGRSTDHSALEIGQKSSGYEPRESWLNAICVRINLSGFNKAFEETCSMTRGRLTARAAAQQEAYGHQSCRGQCQLILELAYTAWVATWECNLATAAWSSRVPCVIHSQEINDTV